MARHVPPVGGLANAVGGFAPRDGPSTVAGVQLSWNGEPSRERV